MRLPLALATMAMLGACKTGEASRPPVGAPDATSAPGVASAGALGPYAADIRTICDGPNDPVIVRLKGDAGSMTLDPSQLVRVTAELVTPRLATDEGRTFFRSLAAGSMAPATKASKLRGEATRAGLSTCAFADIWDPPAAANAAPSASASTRTSAATCPKGAWHGPTPMLIDKSPCPAGYDAQTTIGGGQKLCLLECSSVGDCCGGYGFACRSGHCTMN
jgi:hypothetical protein